MITRYRYFLLAAALLCGILACNNKNTKVEPDKQQETMIVGIWTLQKQNMVQYTNNVQAVDTVLYPSDSTISAAQFNSDGSYNSTSEWFANYGKLNATAENASVDGTYKFSGTTFTMSTGLAGLYFGGSPSYLGTTTGTGLPVSETLVSESVKLNALTTNTLSIHTDITYSTNTGTSVVSTRTVDDFYYAK
jgi:hypothetical protein